jgi:hypothetical protein
MAAPSNRAARVLTRAVLLGAVLAGLFLMHGPSGAAGGGCHGGGPVMVGTTHHEIDLPAGAAGSQAPEHRAGGLCLAIPVRAGANLIQPGPLPLVVVASLAMAVSAAVTGSARSPGRAPPSGRVLLTQVCVSRT